MPALPGICIMGASTPWSPSRSEKQKRTCGASLTGPRGPTSSSCSTRPMRSSASLRPRRTPTTATPISKPIASCSGSRTSRAWWFLPLTFATASTQPSMRRVRDRRVPSPKQSKAWRLQVAHRGKAKSRCAPLLLLSAGKIQ